MDNESFSKKLNNIFNKATYFDKYGGSFLISVLWILIFFIIFSYFYIMNKIEPIKNDWANKKCHPAVIPFAGIIMNDPNKSFTEFTTENFSFCVNKILTDIIGYFLQPIYFSSNIVNNLFITMSESIQSIRKLFSHVRNQFEKITLHIINKINNIIIPIQKILIKFKDSMSKSVGALTTVLYTVMASYLSLKSFMGSFLKIVIAGLVIFAAAIIAMWILPFTWPIAAASTTLFLAISIPMAIIAGWMGHILNLSSRSIPGKPGKPSCFDKNTTIKTINGDIKIKNLKKGTTLIDGSIVTAVLKLSINNQDMYKLNNTIVSGTHKVFHNTLGWIFVKEHPDSIIIDNYKEPYIYCFNTDTKRIKINNNKYLDWDELEPVDIIKLKNLNYLNNNSSLKDIHFFLEGGIKGSTLIQMDNNCQKPINKIKVNDIIKNNNKVLGIVKIDTQNIETVYKYTINNYQFIGTDNINVFDTDLGDYCIHENKIKQKQKPKILYHLITENGFLYINNIRFQDYDSTIENIIDDRNKIFLH
jgi:hypothetical protein